MNQPRVYRKRPVAVEAMQWVGGRENAQLVMNWAHNYGTIIEWVPVTPEERLDDGTLIVPEIPEHMEILTLEGRMAAHTGDFVIRGVRDEFYPCKAAIFEATYTGVSPAVNEALIRRAKRVIAMVVPTVLNGIQVHRIAKQLAENNLLAPPDTEPASLARPEPQRLDIGVSYHAWAEAAHEAWNEAADAVLDDQGKAFPEFRDRVLEDPEARAAYEQAHEEFEALDQRVTEAEQSGQTEAIDQEDTY